MKVERRLFKRFPANLNGTIILEGKRYIGQLKNLSESGIGFHSLLDCFYYQRAIAPDKKVTLVFSDSSNNELSLNCEIRWANELSDDSSKPFFGFKILNPSNAHKDFVNTL